MIGARALQISQGAPVTLEVPREMIDPVLIAIEEYKAGTIPITINKQD